MEGLGFGITLSLNDLFSGALENAVNNFKGLESASQSISKSLENNLKSVYSKSLEMTKPFIEAINTAADFSDINADIMKTTGQTLEEVAKFSKELENLDTRTSLKGLLEISKIGGSIGVATNEMLGFTSAIDMANVALGDEFKGGAQQITKELGTLKNLFNTTKAMDYGLAMSSIGSAINELGAVGLATGANMTDFAKRIGQLGEIAPTLTATLGLGATLEELGLKSEVAAGGLTNVFLIAGQNSEKFAQQIGLSLESFRELYSTNPEEIIMKLGQSFKGMDEVSMIEKLKELKINTKESIKVFSSLKDNTELLQKRMELAGSAFASNTSLSKEFGIKNNTLGASLEKVSNVLTNISKSLGESLSGAVQPLSDGFVNIGKSVNSFIQTPIGGVLTKIAAGFVFATVGITGFTLATTVGIPMLGTFAGALWTATAPLLPFVGAIIAVAGAIYFLKESYNSFTDVLNGGAKADGFLGFMQKMGGAIHGIIEVFSTAGKEGFSMSEDLQKALAKVGILDFVVSIGTWAVRIKEFFNGFASGFDRLSTQMKPLMTAFGTLGDTIGNLLSRFGVDFEKNTSSVTLWSLAGKSAFELVMMPITALTFILTNLANTFGFIIDVGMAFYDNFTGLFADLGFYFNSFMNGTMTFGQVIEAVFDNIGERVTAMLDKLLNAWNTFKTTLIQSVQSLPFGDKLLGMAGINPNTKQGMSQSDKLNELAKMNEMFNSMQQQAGLGEYSTDDLMQRAIKGNFINDNHKEFANAVGSDYAEMQTTIMQDPQLAQTFNQQKKAKDDKETYQQTMVNFANSPQQPQPLQPYVLNITNVTELDGQVVAKTVREINENEGNRQ